MIARNLLYVLLLVPVNLLAGAMLCTLSFLWAAHRRETGRP